MGNSIDELTSFLQPICRQFLANAEAAGISCFLVDTGRTPAEQEQKLAQGVSWVSRSKHEPQPPEGKSLAFDVVPKAYMSMKLWNPGGGYWAKLGEIGERLGLKWGGSWKSHPDPGHFEWDASSSQSAQSPGNIGGPAPSSQ